MIPWLEGDEPFPPLHHALRDPPGLLAAGGDLGAKRLVDAYRHGIFPWFSDDQPILWWSPDPRMVLDTDRFHLSHSLKKLLRPQRRAALGIEIRCDQAFEAVMRACAEPRPHQAGTWITESIIQAYLDLHRLGFAHSVETYVDAQLVGGLYGVSIGRMFFGESMFARRPDASKLALAALVFWLREEQFPMIDCQQQTAHLASLGARPIAREEFARRLARLVREPPPVAWPTRFDPFALPSGLNA